MNFFRTLALLAALTASAAQARVVFEAGEHPVSAFRDVEKVEPTCSGADASFLCALQDATLTRIPTKGVDLFFTPSGELAAAYGKAQRGQTLNEYTLDVRTNLIPFDSAIPGMALLIDGVYHLPENVDGGFVRADANTYVGTFHARVADFDVERIVRVSNVRDTTDVWLRVTRAATADAAPDAAAGVAEDGAADGAADSAADGADAAIDAAAQAPGGETLIQIAMPGIGRTASPVVKIGQGEQFSLNPPERSVPDASYASLQNNDNNREFVLLMVPGESAEGLAASYMRPNRIAFETTVTAGAGAEAVLDVGVYTGNNELVRYSQEGYLELPGLFRPNILGRLSLAIIWVLEYIHRFVPSWGLSIIVLTLLFRALVWPLITTQTKSMFGMQKLQPKLQEMQRKYKDDREKLTQETMKLYREAGVNPAGGCLPVLLQMPLFIILWRVFVNFEFGEGFLWLPDLGQSDPFYILPILYVAVMVATSWFSARGNPQMLRQSMIINVVFVFIIVGFPAGVLLYYVVSMLVQVIQYWLISRGQVPPRAAVAVAGKRGK
ncbi:MAG: YidC/Oxa1 family membrane protein insertase [Trueperaceae bacterium]